MTVPFKSPKPKYRRVILLVLTCFCLFVRPCKAQKNTGDAVKVMAGTYPFSEAVSVVIVAYPDRIYWDNSDPFSKGPQHIIANGDLERPGLVQERRVLNKQEQKKVFDALYSYRKCRMDNSYGCYEPSDLILQ